MKIWKLLCSTSIFSSAGLPHKPERCEQHSRMNQWCFLIYGGYHMSYARMKSPFAYMSLLGVFFRLTFILSQKKKEKKMERVIATIIHTLFLSIVE